MSEQQGDPSPADGGPEPTPAKEKIAGATRKGRNAVGDAVTSAKESAVGAFDKVIDSLDSLGDKNRDKQG